MLGQNLLRVYVGNEAIKRRGIMGLKYPIDAGVITNFDNIEELWKYAFMHELYVLPERQSVLLTDSPTNEKSNRETMAQVAFESLNINALNISSQAALALYAAGRTTGIVLDSGEGVTHATTIFNGIPISEAVQKMKIGGKVLSDQLILRLGEKGFPLVTTQERMEARIILMQESYVATNYHKEMELDGPELEPYELPDGTKIVLEALFQPSLHGLDTPMGIHSLVNMSIGRADPSIQTQLYKNIVVAGGNTMFPGFVDRLKAEIVTLAPSDMTVSLAAPSDRHIATWLGGSILSSLSIFNQMLVTKEEYEEKGPSVVHTRWL
ncbi:hypothetical protein EST38_g12227 [Candolleomyces aberdarensis]|uniref:Actin n=1 Tax=Candolleomyces aberdarensis TaxID=2316362 RepID=A0A4Q2D3N8_9AGAR|nr:hypothetical protein EST38_g12227 [Candolleomyces aberdarensis]